MPSVIQAVAHDPKSLGRLRQLKPQTPRLDGLFCAFPFIQAKRRTDRPHPPIGSFIVEFNLRDFDEARSLKTRQTFYDSQAHRFERALRSPVDLRRFLSHDGHGVLLTKPSSCL